MKTTVLYSALAISLPLLSSAANTYGEVIARIAQMANLNTQSSHIIDQLGAASRAVDVSLPFSYYSSNDRSPGPITDLPS